MAPDRALVTTLEISGLGYVRVSVSGAQPKCFELSSDELAWISSFAENSALLEAIENIVDAGEQYSEQELIGLELTGREIDFPQKPRRKT